ncbi:hypothetical protein Tco_0520559, partial [Tanacetum coccineum]
MNPNSQLLNLKFNCTLIRIGITALKNDADVDAFVNLGYQNKWVVDLYVEHNGYDALDIRDQAETLVNDQSNESSDSYYSSDDEDLGFMDFIQKEMRIGFIDEHVNDNVERVVEDTKSIDPEFNVNKANNGEGTSKSSQTTTKSSRTTSKSGEGCSQSPKWTKSRISSDR